MTKQFSFSPALLTGLASATLLSIVFVGCMPGGSVQGRGSAAEQTGRSQAVVGFDDDYDYYPGYEVYYSRSRHEYVFRDGNTWVRRSEPRGVSVSVLLAAPRVQVDFHDSPEKHHAAITQNYPKSWKQPVKVQDSKTARRVEQKGDDRKTKDDQRKDDVRQN